MAISCKIWTRIRGGSVCGRVFLDLIAARNILLGVLDFFFFASYVVDWFAILH